MTVRQEDIDALYADLDSECEQYRREYLLMRDIADAEEQRWRKARIVGWSILAAVAVLFLSWAVA